MSRHIRGGIGLLGLYATIAAWRHAEPWLAEARAYLQANRDFLVETLRDELPEVVCHPPQATYLAWLDFRALDLQPSPARFFYDEVQVALSDGAAFGPTYAGHARSILSEVLEKVVKAVRTR